MSRARAGGCGRRAAALALAVTLLSLLPAARLGSWVAVDLIGLWWGLESLAGLLVTLTAAALPGAAAWILGRRFACRWRGEGA